MKLTGFAFGIRTVKSFSVEDKLGAIIDEILYSENSEFNEKLFTEVRENHNTKLLFDPVGLNKFTITPRDYIFEYSIKKDFDKELEKFLTSYINIVTKKVFKTFSIRNISRFGFLIKAELTEKDLLLKEVTDIIKKHKGVDDSLSLRFNVITKKPLKLTKIVTEDYDSEIVTYDKPDAASPLSFSVDFQKYFKPELNIIEDATQDYETFCKSTYSIYKATYLKNEQEFKKQASLQST